MRPRPLCAAFTVLVATIGLTTALPAASAGPAAHQARYAVDQRVCPPPTRPGEFTCFAIRHVPASRTTPGAKAEPDVSTAPVWTRGPSGGLTPRALASAYHYQPAVGGSLQTVGIVDWYDDPNLRADLNAFDRHYGLPTETATSLRKVNEFGNASPLPQADRNSAVEIALDVETVRAVCTHCKILLVEASRPQAWNLARAENTAVRLGATEVSNSFGTYEHRGHQFAEWLRLAFDHHGVVITASTGDDGWYGWDVVDDPSISGVPGAPAFPSTSPKVVAVGGTRLNLDAGGRRSTEPAWDDDGLDNRVGRVHGPVGAAGSGCSTLLDAPAWQTAAPNYARSGCAGKRFTADVAADAAPATGLDIYDTYGGHGWETVGGTSLSAPIIAALWAHVGGAGGVDFPARNLYQNRALRPNTVWDVVSGGSSWCGGDTIAGCSAAVQGLSGRTENPNVYEGARVDCSYPLFTERASSAPPNLSCNAAHGLDGPTGVGAPTGTTLFRSPLPQVTIHPPAQPIEGITQRYTASVVDPVPGAHPTRYVWFWGDHSTPTSTTTRAATHRYARGGTFTVLVRVADTVGQVGSGSRQIAAVR